ncbi:hypothetical protein HRbin06_00500 [archaeon HR06]|nr:hypothetical protein HRbin06_00500 [archaeon HR06]
MNLYLKIRRTLLAILGWFLIIFGIYFLPRGIIEGSTMILIGLIFLYYALKKSPIHYKG